MKFLLDMNLSPKWVDEFVKNGHHAIHWTNVGNHNAADSSIMVWARENDYIVFTHDLDFGSILSATQAISPSVLQLRTQDVSPQHLSGRLFSIIERYQAELEDGSLIIIDERKNRIRLLPISRA